MKKEIFLSLLIVLGLSFAQSPPITSGPEWWVFHQAVCQGGVTAFQTMAVSEMPYYVYTGSCVVPETTYSVSEICEQVCYEDGLLGGYWDMCGACDKMNPSYTLANCMNAKRQFYSVAGASRSMFSLASREHLSFAKQAIYAYNIGECETLPGDVFELLAMTSYGYRECVGYSPDELLDNLWMFCGDFCPPEET